MTEEKPDIEMHEIDLDKTRKVDINEIKLEEEKDALPAPNDYNGQIDTELQTDRDYIPTHRGMLTNEDTKPSKFIKDTDNELVIESKLPSEKR